MTILSHRRSATGPRRRAGSTTTRIGFALAGALLALCSLGVVGLGGAALWASDTQRHGGDIDLGTWSYRSAGYAVVSSTADLYGATGGLPVPRSLLGTVRISVTSAPGAWPGIRRDRPGPRGWPLPDRGRLRHRPRHHPPSRHLDRAWWRRSRDRARPGRHLGHPGGRARHPDADLARPRRRLDGGCHGRRRITARRRAHHRRRVGAIAALDRCCPAGLRPPHAGRRIGSHCRSRPPRSQSPHRSRRPMTDSAAAREEGVRAIFR